MDPIRRAECHFQQGHTSVLHFQKIGRQIAEKGKVKIKAADGKMSGCENPAPLSVPIIQHDRALHQGHTPNRMRLY